MSVESAKKFIERLATDEKFRAEVDAAPDPVAKKKIVQAAGYDFDVADIAAVMPHSMGGELSDQDLQGVAGGANEVTYATISATAGFSVSMSVVAATAAAI